jgi:hypothetical protein
VVIPAVHDVWLQVLTGEERGFKLFFEFAENNKYFNNKVIVLV